MHFSVSHLASGIDLPAYEALFFDEAFNTAMCAELGLQRRLVRREQVGGSLQRVVEVAPQRELPAPLQKLLGGGRLAYEEHVDYAWGSYRGTWRTVPSLLADKIQAAGSFAFSARGADVERTYAGDVTVKIFGLGGVVERFIIADVEQSYARAAAFTATWRARRGA